MKNFVLGFISALVIIGLIYTITEFLIPGFKSASQQNRISEQKIECQNINPEVREYGNLKLQVIYQGQPASDLEVDLSREPGADEYCYKTTDSQGYITVNKMPVGNYYVYFNMSNYPDKYGIPSAQEKFQIDADKTLEFTLNLDDYQK